MKRFHFLLLFVLLCASPLHAKLLTPPAAPNTRTIQQRPVGSSIFECIAAAGMSSEEQAAYNKIGGVVPDIFCCSSAVVDRETCLDEKADALNRLTKFINDNFGAPLTAKLGLLSFDSQICSALSRWEDESNTDSTINMIKCHLNNVGDALSRYQSLLNSLK